MRSIQAFPLLCLTVWFMVFVAVTYVLLFAFNISYIYCCGCVPVAVARPGKGASKNGLTYSGKKDACPLF